MNRLMAGCATAFASAGDREEANMSASSESASAAAREQAGGASRACSRAWRAARPPRSGQAAARARPRARRRGRTRSPPPPPRPRCRPGRRGSGAPARRPGSRAGRTPRPRRPRGQGIASRATPAPTRFAITITPAMHSTAPITSKTAPALIIRVIGKQPGGVDDRVGWRRDRQHEAVVCPEDRGERRDRRVQVRRRPRSRWRSAP